MKKPVVKLNNWACRVIRNGDDYYQAPELFETRITGAIEGHPTRPDGQEVIIGRVVTVDDRHVETKNTIYELCEPEPEYVAMMKTLGIEIDEQEPIKNTPRIQAKDTPHA